MKSRLIEVTDFSAYAFNLEQMAYFTDYFTNYYNDRFIKDQGTEVILNMLHANQKSGLWLDLGAGPATFFWSLMLDGVRELHCNELNPEGIKVLSDFAKSATTPQCYKDVMDIYNIPEEKLTIAKKMPRKYLLFDALRAWPDDLQYTYDMITGFGVYGLASNKGKYVECFSHPRKYLKDGGLLVGANWVRSELFISKGNSDNRFLTQELVKEAAKRYGYQILHLSEETIVGDPYYDKVVVWCLRKKV